MASYPEVGPDPPGHHHLDGSYAVDAVHEVKDVDEADQPQGDGQAEAHPPGHRAAQPMQDEDQGPEGQDGLDPQAGERGQVVQVLG